MSSENSPASQTSSKPSEGFYLRHRDFIQRILILIIFAAVLLIIWHGAEILLLVFAGLLLAVFLRTASLFLNRLSGVPEKWALAIVICGIIAVTGLGIWFLSDSVQRQFGELSESLPVAYEKLRERIAGHPLGKRIVEQIPQPQQLVFGRQTGNVFGRVTGLFSTAFDLLVNILIVVVTAVYLAFSPKLYREGAIKLFPLNHEKRVREVLFTIVFTLRRFLLGISVSMLINGALTAAGLWLLDVPFAVPLGIIAGLLTFIPNIGPIIAGAPAVVIALSQNPWQALYVLILYLFVQNLDGFVITPLIQQKAISVPPVPVVAAQLLLAVMFGFLGLLLAVPIVAVLFVTVKMVYLEDFLNRRVEVKGEREAQEKT